MQKHQHKNGSKHFQGLAERRLCGCSDAPCWQLTAHAALSMSWVESALKCCKWCRMNMSNHMQRALLGVLSKNALCSVSRWPLSCQAKLRSLQYQRRHYSKYERPYDFPEIHFETETPPSSPTPYFTLRTRLHLPAPLQSVWSNFHTPRTLNAITPPHLNSTVTSAQPVQMHEGTIIDYR